MRKLIVNRIGLTLIEVMVSLVIFAIVSSMAFRMIDFSLTTLLFSSNEVNDTANLRLAAYKITDTVRNARTVSVVSSVSLTDVANEYIYLHADGTLRHRDGGVDQILSDDLIDTVDFGLAEQNGKYLLTIYIKGESNELSTEVLLNNISSATAGNDSVFRFDFNAPSP